MCSARQRPPAANATCPIRRPRRLHRQQPQRPQAALQLRCLQPSPRYGTPWQDCATSAAVPQALQPATPRRPPPGRAGIERGTWHGTPETARHHHRSRQRWLLHPSIRSGLLHPAPRLRLAAGLRLHRPKRLHACPKLGHRSRLAQCTPNAAAIEPGRSFGTQASTEDHHLGVPAQRGLSMQPVQKIIA